MKHKILTLSGAAVAAAVLSTSAFATDAQKHVYVQVAPSITVSATGTSTNGTAGNPQNVDLGSQGGTFSQVLDFQVDANVESLSLGVTTTNLYKGDDPTNQDVAPLAVDQPHGVTITADNATPMAGGSNSTTYAGADNSVTDSNGNTFDGFVSNNIPFESSQNGDFSQPVHVDVGWIVPPEQPQGEYSGYVVLHTALVGTP